MEEAYILLQNVSRHTGHLDRCLSCTQFDSSNFKMFKSHSEHVVLSVDNECVTKKKTKTQVPDVIKSFP